MAQSARQSAAARPGDPTELRLLLELPALRELADRGLSDGELATIRQLASAAMGPALGGDIAGYLRADMVFHLCLVELTGDPTRSQVARLLLAAGVEYGPHDAELSRRMAAGAEEHSEIVNLLADDKVSAAEDLLRQHITRYGARRPGRPVSDPTRSVAGAEPGERVDLVTRADLDAFFRHHGDMPMPSRLELTGALSRLKGSDDPIVTFARLARACVPAFADGSKVELSDGREPPFSVRHPPSPADGPDQAGAQAAGPHPVLLTPFRVASRAGYPSYAGTLTHWWAGREPTTTDAVIADLMVKHAIALVDRERLTAAAAAAERHAASLALEAISGRVINLATGIVMHQRGLSQDDAEDVLRQAAAAAGSSLPAVAASVVHEVSAARLPTGDGRPRR